MGRKSHVGPLIRTIGLLFRAWVPNPHAGLFRAWVPLIRTINPLMRTWAAPPTLQQRVCKLRTTHTLPDMGVPQNADHLALNGPFSAFLTESGLHFNATLPQVVASAPPNGNVASLAGLGSQ